MRAAEELFTRSGFEGTSIGDIGALSNLTSLTLLYLSDNSIIDENTSRHLSEVS